MIYFEQLADGCQLVRRDAAHHAMHGRRRIKPWEQVQGEVAQALRHPVGARPAIIVDHSDHEPSGDDPRHRIPAELKDQPRRYGAPLGHLKRGCGPMGIAPGTDHRELTVGLWVRSLAQCHRLPCVPTGVRRDSSPRTGSGLYGAGLKPVA